MTHSPKCVSQILIPLDSHFDIYHHHQMLICRSSKFHSLVIFLCSKHFTYIFYSSYHDNFHDQATIAHKDEFEYNVSSQNLLGRSGRLAYPTFINSHTIWEYISLLNYNLSHCNQTLFQISRYLSYIIILKQLFRLLDILDTKNQFFWTSRIMEASVILRY